MSRTLFSLMVALAIMAWCFGTAAASGGVGDGPGKGKPSARTGGGIGDAPGDVTVPEPEVTAPPVEDPEAVEPEPEVMPEEPSDGAPVEPSVEPSVDPEGTPAEPEAREPEPSQPPVARDADPDMDDGGPTAGPGPSYPRGGGGDVPAWIPEVLIRLPWIVGGGQIRNWTPRWNGSRRLPWNGNRQGWRFPRR